MSETILDVEYEAALRRAFVDRRAGFIRLDGHSGRFLFDAAAYGQERGWLGPVQEWGDEQWTEYRLRLTPQGKAYFGLERQP